MYTSSCLNNAQLHPRNSTVCRDVRHKFETKRLKSDRADLVIGT